MAKSTPDDMNFTYRAKPSPYFKVGANYNFMFKSDPDYQIFAGIRLGYSSFAYDVTDVHYVNSYWQEDIPFDITGQRSHALWGEAGIGIKVRLAGQLSMGWMIRYHSLFKCADKEHSRPWFIPGYGPRNNSLGLSVSLYYTLPLHRGGKTDNNIEHEHDRKHGLGHRHHRSGGDRLPDRRRGTGPITLFRAAARKFDEAE